MDFEYTPVASRYILTRFGDLIVTYLSGVRDRLTNCHDDGGRKPSAGICKIVT